MPASRRVRPLRQARPAPLAARTLDRAASRPDHGLRIDSTVMAPAGSGVAQWTHADGFVAGFPTGPSASPPARPVPLVGDPAKPSRLSAVDQTAPAPLPPASGASPDRRTDRRAERETTADMEGRQPAPRTPVPDDPPPRNLSPAPYGRASRVRAVHECGHNRSGTGSAGVTTPARRGRRRRARRAARRPARRRCATLPASAARSRRRCGSPGPAAHSCGSR